MERKIFIKQIGISLALVCGASCIGSCSKNVPVQGPGKPPPFQGSVNVDASVVPNIGDYYRDPNSQLLLIRLAAGNASSSFVASQKACPHMSGDLIWRKDLQLVQCQLHNSEYKSDGSVIQGPQKNVPVPPTDPNPTTSALAIYKISVSGTTLTISSS